MCADLLQDGKIKSLEQIYLHSLKIKEYQIVDFFLPSVKDEVMKIMPVQKQTRAGQRTRFKAFVCVGDHDGHIGLGVKCAKVNFLAMSFNMNERGGGVGGGTILQSNAFFPIEQEVATAIRGAIITAKINIMPVRRGYWGSTIGKPHTVPMKITGFCGSVTVRLIPAPRGAGIVAGVAPKKVLQMAGLDDVFTASRGHRRTLGNFVKATFDALSKTYGFLTPDLWRETRFLMTPFQEFTDLLAKPAGAKQETIE